MKNLAEIDAHERQEARADLSRYIDRKEVADRTGIDARTLLRLEHNGGGPPVYRPPGLRKSLYRWDQVVIWIEADDIAPSVARWDRRSVKGIREKARAFLREAGDTVSPLALQVRELGARQLEPVLLAVMERIEELEKDPATAESAAALAGSMAAFVLATEPTADDIGNIDEAE